MEGDSQQPDVVTEEILRELFERAVELPPEERRAFVSRECGGRAEIADELARLLEHEARLGGFLLPVRPAASPRRPRVLLLAEGERLEFHEIEGFLGGGGGGQVFRARRVADGAPVALKVVDAASLGGGDRERFLRGAETAAELRHPGLVEVYASGEDLQRGLLHYSMRLVEGPSLEHVLARLGGRPPSTAVRRALVERALEVAEALAELHRRGLVHRDVKPANVLVEGAGDDEPWSGRAVLVDYGLLRSLGKRAESTALGTLPYAAPELFLEGRVDERADVYGLGLCLYDLVAGCRPTGRGGAELERLARRVPDIEPALEAIVERAIDPDPRHRYPDGAAMAHDLAAFLAGERVRARPLTRLQLLRRSLRRRPDRALRIAGRVALAAGAAVVAVLAAWGGWASLRARAVQAAWSQGDLATLASESRALGWPERRLLLDARVMASVAELSGAGPLATVAAAQHARGDAAALELAARTLSRDGLASHPVLLRFLVHGMLRSPARADALRWTALLLLELPAETPAELETVRPLADALLHLLERDALAGADRLYAIGALGCGGGATSGPALVACARRAAASGDAEELRLALRALQLSACRSRGAGFAHELCAADWDGDLRALRPAALRLAGATGECAFRHVFEDVASIVALRRGQEGLPPLAPDLAPESLAFRAANRDPRIQAALDEPPHLFRILVDGAGREHDVVPVVGRALGLLGISLGAVDAELFLQSSGLDVHPARDVGWLQANIAVGREEAEGIVGEWRPDADTRLGTWFDESRCEWEAVRSALPVRTGFAPEVVAGWVLCSDGVWLHGRALGLAQRCAPLRSDAPPGGFARLGHGGLSELQLTFAVDEELAGRPLRVRVAHQRGLRPWLPYEGEAPAILRSGATEVGFTTVGRSIEWLDVAIEPPVPDERGEASLTISLETPSTTTFRIYRVELVAP